VKEKCSGLNGSQYYQNLISLALMRINEELLERKVAAPV
jgi:hypothetical protein